MAFRGIKLEHLRLLDLRHTTWELGDGAGGIRDASDLINVFFDRCSFPKLERICIGHLEEVYEKYDDDESLYRGIWRRPPSTGLQQLINAFPVLRCMELYGLNMSRDVADYLGSFRRQTGGEIDIRGNNQCHIVGAPLLSPERQQLLEMLAINLKKWIEFCLRHVASELFNDCFYWNCLPDVQFKRVAYGGALVECTDVTKLENFIKLVEAEKGNVMKEGALDALKALKEQFLRTQKEYGVIQQLTWAEPSIFVDMRAR